MSGVETFRSTIIETCKPEQLEKYRLVQRQIQQATAAFMQPNPYGRHDSTSGLGQWFIWNSRQPLSVANKMDPNDPTTKAAMLVGAISLRAWLYKSDSDTEGHKNIKSSDVWKNTRLQKLAFECDKVVADIAPETRGRFVDIDLTEMANRHKEGIHSNADEHIVVTGLNAVGKTTVLNIFSNYLNDCNVVAKVIKMPRPDGPLSKVILPALNGELRIAKNALQMIFLADALDFEPEPETLIVFDRHPIASEAFVYGPEEIARTVLSTQEIRNQIFQTFILDQHPMSCARRVAERSSAPRIFENDVEKMTEQLIRFARLTVLPGTHWINNDIPSTETYSGYKPELIAAERFIGSVFHSGVLQRRLLKQGRFSSYSEASSFLYDKAHTYMN